MSEPRIEVRKIPQDRFGLFVNDVLIGDAKNQFDADHAVVMLRRALGVENVAN